MENVGGELNAYTTKEDTFVYSIFMEEHYERAFDLLADIIFHSRFPQHEVEKEIDVILDEINSYKDSPSELIYDEFENILFNGHSLGHNILGNEESLLRFTSGTGYPFVSKYYVPGNMVFFSMGRKEMSKIIRLAENTVGNLQYVLPANERKIPAYISSQNKQVDKETYQSHILIGGKSYDMYDNKRIPLFLLNNMLGGPGMNSRLNLSLREKHGLVYSVESNITSYTDTGVATIYFGTDPKNTEKALNLVYKELKCFQEKKLTDLQLAFAKKQVIGQLGVANDNKESLFLGLGKSFLHYNRYDTLPEVFAKIDKVTSGDITAVANEIFSAGNLSSLIYK
jgi:predicted Zn-dependent peptidase